MQYVRRPDVTAIHQKRPGLAMTKRLSASRCHECDPGVRLNVGRQASGTGLVADTCSTETYALLETGICRCHT